MHAPDSTRESFTTLTHARLRVRQGDYAGAERLLGRLLDRQPDHEEARALLRSIAGRTAVESRPPETDAPEPRLPGAATELAQRFREALAGKDPRRARIRRLEAWLARFRPSS